MILYDNPDDIDSNTPNWILSFFPDPQSQTQVSSPDIPVSVEENSPHSAHSNPPTSQLSLDMNSSH